MMNLFTRILANLFLIVAVFLSGCGGGGSNDVVVSKPGQALFSSAPSALTMNTGDSLSYKIGGGGNGSAFASYTVSSSNSNIATATNTGTDLQISAVASGASNVTIQDSVGGSIVIKVTVENPLAFKIMAPEVISIMPKFSDSFSIRGGTAPYTVTSSNQGIVKPAVSGSVVTVNAIAVGGAQVLVFDSKGNSSSIVVNVKEEGVIDIPLFTTAPSFVNLVIGETFQDFKIGGGKAPYNVTTSAPNVIEVSSIENTFSIRPKKLGFGVINITDALGKSVSLQTIVNSGKDSVVFHTSASSTLSLAIGTSSTYDLFGGTAPYTVTSSNPSVATVNLIGTKFTITAHDKGASSIVAKDSVGTVITIALTVPDNKDPITPIPFYSTAPGSVVVQPGITSKFNVAGGTGPYQVSSSNASVVAASILGNTLSLVGNQIGTSKVLLKDAVGTSINIDVNVSSPTTGAFYSSANTTVTLAIGTSSTYDLFGGTAPYTVTSSNPSVATVNLIGTKFTITAHEKGASSIVAKDAIGAVVTIALSVPDNKDPITPIPLYSTAPGSVVVQPGVTSTFSVAGGTGPYQVSSSNSGVVTASISGNTLSIIGNQIGTATVLVKDSTGATINLAVTVPSTTTGQVSTNLFTTAPPAVTLKVGTSETYSLSGGKAPYTATSSDTSIVQVSTTNNGKFTLTSVAVGNVNVYIVDQNGSSVTLAVTTKL